MIDITARGMKGRKTAVALGFFDGLHLGHIEVINAALARKDLAAVVFTFNNKTLLPKFNTRENIITHELKLELLSKIGVDYIFAPDFADVQDYSPEEFVKKILVDRLNASYVTCGYDFHFGKNGAGDPTTLCHICREYGIEVCVVSAVRAENGEIISSTVIRKLIKEGDVALANKYLGYELTYVLEVEHGRKLGKKLGFPTINQTIPKGTIIPKFGVYKSWTVIGGHNYPSITNIGVKPTVNGDNAEPNMETHIIGWAGDLYGLRTRVVLREYVRGERKFASLDELKAQIKADKEYCMK